MGRTVTKEPHFRRFLKDHRCNFVDFLAHQMRRDFLHDIKFAPKNLGSGPIYVKVISCYMLHM